MKIALVTSFPPSRLGINEYSRHLVFEMAQNPSLQIVILADETSGNPPELKLPPNVTLVRCWRYNDSRNLWRVIRALRRHAPDVVNIQMLFSSFGDRRLPAALGLMIPLVIKAMGYPVIVTLHHLIQFIDLNSTVLGRSRLSQWVLNRVTRWLVASTTLVVLQKRYVEALRQFPGGEKVRLIRHGYFTFPGRPRSYLAGHRLLVFGKFGTYKRLEHTFDVYQMVKKEFPQASLTVCGTSHPSTPHYLEGIRKRYEHLPDVQFTGYVAEEDLPAVMAKCDLMFLTYESCTGVASAELHACRFGLPIVNPIVAELSSLHEEEGIQTNGFIKGDVAGAAKVIVDLFNDRNRMQFDADINFALALRTPMSEVAEAYVNLAAELVDEKKGAGRSGERPRKAA